MNHNIIHPADNSSSRANQSEVNSAQTNLWAELGAHIWGGRELFRPAGYSQPDLPAGSLPTELWGSNVAGHHGGHGGFFDIELYDSSLVSQSDGLASIPSELSDTGAANPPGSSGTAGVSPVSDSGAADQPGGSGGPSPVESGDNSTFGQQAGASASSPAQTPAEAEDSGSAGSAPEAQLPPLQLGDFKAEALRVFDHLDPNHTGSVSLGQMADAIQHDPSIKGRDAEALAAMYDLKVEEGRIHSLPGVNADAITRADIEQVPDSLQQECINQDQLHMITDPMLSSKFDPNNSGRISQAEVANVMGDKMAANYGQITQAYAAEHLDPAEQAQVRQNGLTPDELTGLAKEQHFKVFLADAVSHRLQRADASLASSKDKQLYENSTEPLQSIKPDDVKQGLAGDCYFNSVLSSVAAKQPGLIGDAIQKNQDGSYTVTFKGEPSDPITVPAPTDAELSLYDSASRDGIWPCVMEKAFAKYQDSAQHRSLQNKTTQDAASSGNPWSAFYLLTGQTAGHSDIPTPAQIEDGTGSGATSESLIEGLKLLTTNGNYTFVGTSKGAAPGENGLAPGHVYSVVGYEDGPDGGTFELRNPWGDANRKNGDYFKISANKLAASLNDITYSDMTVQATAPGAPSNTPFEGFTPYLPG